VPVKEQISVRDFVDDIAEEGDDRSSQTEEYIDPHTANYADFPKGDEVEEPGVGVDDEDETEEQVG
jgi:hypothetical protein